MYKLFIKLTDNIEIDDRYVYIADDGKVLRLTASEILDSTSEISTEKFMKECNGNKDYATELINNFLDKR